MLMTKCTIQSLREEGRARVEMRLALPSSFSPAKEERELKAVR